MHKGCSQANETNISKFSLYLMGIKSEQAILLELFWKQLLSLL